MKNIFKASKRGIAALLTLCILLGIAGISVHATAVAEETTVITEEAKVATEDNTVATEENTQELVPMMARACSYHHYEVNGYHGNGYVKSVTVTTYYNGKAISTYTVDYPSSGEDSMKTFHGCKCPMCK